MFAEPITITIDGVAKSFRRTSAGSPGRFQTPDGEFALEISQSLVKGKKRYNARLVQTLMGPDALNPAIQKLHKREYWGGHGASIANPVITDAVAAKVSTGFLNWLNLPATQASLQAGES